MEGKFDSNVMKLEKEIFDISKNINKFKNKNHITMKNMMEKLKSFSSEPKSKDEQTNLEEYISKEKKKKSLIKTYQSLSNGNLSPNTPNNNMYQYEDNYNNNKRPIILKENDLYNYDDNTNIFSSNINSYNEKMYKLKKENSNINDGRRTCKSIMNKCFSFNLNDLKNNDQDNNDIKRRTNSYNNIKVKNIFNNDVYNEGANNDFLYPIKIKKNNKIEINKNNIKKNNNINKNEISKKIIRNIKSLINNQNNSAKQINNIKREHCNINISEYYKNINNKENSSKKKNGKIKIVTNNKKLRNFSSARNNSYKLDNNNTTIINGNNSSSNHSTRNSIYDKMHSNTYNNKSNNNPRDYNICVCTTFNPEYQNTKNNESNFEDESFKEKTKILNTFRDNNLLNKNLMMINNNKINSLKEYQFYNKIERNSDNNYNYYKNKKNISYNINEDIDTNKKKLLTNNNYSKDFIDLITNRNNNSNYKYDNISIYNSHINDKNYNNKNEKNKYISVNKEKYIILLSKLKSKNLDECLYKIDILLNYEEFINKINSLYNKYNNYIKNKEIDLKDTFSWIQLNIENIKKYKDDLKKYQSFCGKLIDEFSVDGYDKIKSDIMKTVNESKRNNNFTYGMKKILYDSYLNNGNIIKNNNENISTNSQFCTSNDNNSSTIKNKTHSYSNYSLTNMQNGEENFNNKTFLTTNRNNKDIISKFNNIV